jgi:hypothetical protein
MRSWIGWGAALGLALGVAAAAACNGGGRTAVVGLGNGGNRIFETGGTAAMLAEQLAAHPGTPEIGDELLAEVFQSIVTHARAGDAEAALILFRVAEEQRRKDEQG